MKKVMKYYVILLLCILVFGLIFFHRIKFNQMWGKMWSW
jgi:hypothetical protein